MEIRPMTLADLDSVAEIDGIVESTRYLHVDRSGEKLEATWAIQDRPLRNKLIEPNLLDEQHRFALKQVVNGIEEGMAIVAKHEKQIVGASLAQPDFVMETLRLIDLRVDFDFRRHGLASAMIFQIIQKA